MQTAEKGNTMHVTIKE